MGESGGRREFFAFGEKCLSCAHRPAEDRVYQSTHGPPGAGHCFVYGCVIRDSQKQELAYPDPQNIPGFVIQFPLAQHADPVIEQASVPQDSEQDAVEERPVGRGEAVASCVPLDQGIGIEVPLGPGSQGRNGSAADILVGHC